MRGCLRGCLRGRCMSTLKVTIIESLYIVYEQEQSNNLHGLSCKDDIYVASAETIGMIMTLK